MGSRYIVAAALVFGLCAGVAACGTSSSAPTAPQFSVAGGASAAQKVSSGYVIGPLDKLGVTVFQVKDLTLEEVQVDNSGQIVLPLIGGVQAAGKTALELSAEIADRLRGRYLQAPEVSIRVVEAVSQKVTVDGSVVEPGVYTMSGPTTLMQAVAMAKGPDPRFANLNKVAIFRSIDGQRNVAVFNLKAIRSGTSPDPLLQGNDVVVVEGSPVKGTLRELLAALPAVALFRPY